MSFPEGYGTMVRNQGKNFSGGQRQRLAIARTLLSDAHILVLDEPTAALDVEAELEVMKALEELVVGRTVLMISHRLSTLGKVDEIIVLKEGKIVELGSYKELKSKPGGVFADLLGKQKQYDADYTGSSNIVPQAEVERLISMHRQGAGVKGDGAAGPVRTGANGKDGRRAAHVVIEIDGRVVGECALTKDELEVGRLSTNDIPVLSERVSRFHARIRWEHGAWVIKDHQSLNGLIYQGEQIDERRLKNGDRIHLAPKVVLVYKEDAKAEVLSFAAVTPVQPLVQ
jgi:ABC-type proline/glycine betaine transport system ATPase subunit